MVSFLIDSHTSVKNASLRNRYFRFLFHTKDMRFAQYHVIESKNLQLGPKNTSFQSTSGLNNHFRFQNYYSASAFYTLKWFIYAKANVPLDHMHGNGSLLILLLRVQNSHKNSFSEYLKFYPL